MKYAFTKSETLTVGGKSLPELIAAEPFKSVVNGLRIGHVKPTVPVLLTHSVTDDVVPSKQGRQLGRDWCKLGADVWFTFTPKITPTHIGGAIASYPAVFAFLEARFVSGRAFSDCGWF